MKNNLDVFPTGDLIGKSNTELLNEIDIILTATISEKDEKRAAEEVDKRLALLQERAPVAEEYDQPTAWKKLIEKYPLIIRMGQAET